MADVDLTAKLNMPTLEGIETSLRGKRMLGHILGIHGPPTPRGRQIADGYVRLVEKTILEYTAARETLTKYLREGTADDLFRAQDHFESCIQALHRAILYLERLRRLGFRQADGSPFVPRTRDLKILSVDVRTRVRRMRDASEHLDADIIDGRLPQDADVGNHLGWDGRQLAGISIQYKELVEWIRQTHHFALLLSRVHIVVRNPDVQEPSEST